MANYFFAAGVRRSRISWYQESVQQTDPSGLVHHRLLLPTTEG